MMTERQWVMCMKLGVTAMVCLLASQCMYVGDGLLGMVGGIVGIAVVWSYVG